MLFKSSIRKLFFHGLFLFGGIAAALLVVEGAFRVLKSPTKLAAQSDRPLFFYPPKQSESMQDFAYPEEKAHDTFRIAVIGDSFSFAPKMQFDDAFPKRLERILQMSGTDTTVEVLNFGTPGSSMVDYVGQMKKVLSYAPDVVLLEVTLNDIQLRAFNPEEVEGRYRFGKPRLEGISKKISQYWKTYGFILRRLQATQSRQDYIRYFHDYYSDPQAWKVFQKSLRSMKKLAIEHKVSLLAVVFPLFGHSLDEDYPFLGLHSKIREELNKNSIPSLDLFATFKGIPLERLQVSPGEDIHPNEIAHRLAAESLYLWFRRESLLPESQLALKTYPFRNNPTEYTRHEMRVLSKGSAQEKRAS